MVNITVKRWLRLLCISTLACLAIFISLILASAAESCNLNNIGCLSNIIFELGEYAKSILPQVAADESAVYVLLGLWATFCTCIFIIAQVIIKPLTCRDNDE